MGDTGKTIALVNAIVGQQLGSVKTDITEIDGDVNAIKNGGKILTEDVKTALLNIFNHITYTDANAQTYITALTNAWRSEGVLTSINAIFTQGSAVIYDNDSLETLKQYLVVNGVYSIGQQTYTEVITNYELSGTLTAGISTITVTVGGLTTTFTVTVTAYNDYEFYTKLIATGQQYIDAGLKETDISGCSFEYKVKPNTTQPGSGHVLSSANTYMAFPQMYSNNLYGRIVAKIKNGTEKTIGSQANPAWNNNDELTIVAYADENKSVKVNGNTVISSVPEGSTESSSNKATLFAYGGNLSNLNYTFRGAFYYLKIYNSSGTMIHHYVPAKKKSTNKYGLYDNVTNDFFSSATQTEFTAE